jgi:hypothetical protein
MSKSSGHPTGRRAIGWIAAITAPAVFSAACAGTKLSKASGPPAPVTAVSESIAPLPPPPLNVRLVTNAVCVNGNDQGLKGPNDETYILRSVQAPGAGQFGSVDRFPKNRKGYWEICKKEKATPEQEVWSGTIQHGQSTIAIVHLMEVAEGAAADPATAWLAAPIAGVAHALRTNKDDYLGTMVVRLQNVNGEIVVTPMAQTERPTNIDRRDINADGSGRFVFHRRNRWAYEMYYRVYSTPVQVATTR